MILIVEDDADNASALREVLEDEGYPVTRACDGHDALRLLGNGLIPQLILVDFMMPNLDGSQFARLVRTDPRWAGVPMLMLTANGQAARDAVGNMVDQCLSKPIDLTVLLHAVEKHVAATRRHG
jgi:two-component system, chemotaxis family, chemotaxis protein CheY